MEAEGPLWQRLKGTAGRKAKQVTFILDMLEYTFYVKVIVLFKKTNKLHSILFWCQMAARYVQAKKNVWYNLCFVFSMQEGDVQRPVQASCEMNINSLFFFHSTCIYFCCSHPTHIWPVSGLNRWSHIVCRDAF